MRPGFAISTIAVFGIGLGFVLAKIALNTILVLHSTTDGLRRSVAKRATLLNVGSFMGNTIALQVTARFGYFAHTVLLGLLHLPLMIGLAAPSVPHIEEIPDRQAQRRQRHLRDLLRNRVFLADCLRRFAVVLPYGCWGTIIPKYVIDEYHSNDPVWFVYLTSVLTTVVGANLLAVYLSAKLYARGFKWEWWSMLSVILFCLGLLLLTFVGHPIMLPIAVVVFICGEVVMTPCFDETAKRHGKARGMGSCMGILHLVDGLGRLAGAAIALAIYSTMRNEPNREFYWPLMAGLFFAVSATLHVVAHLFVHKSAHPSEVQP